MYLSQVFDRILIIIPAKWIKATDPVTLKLLTHYQSLQIDRSRSIEHFLRNRAVQEANRSYYEAKQFTLEAKKKKKK